MISFDWTINVGTLFMLGTIIFAAGGLWSEVRAIKQILKTLLPEKVFEEHKEGVRREINGLARRVDSLEQH